MATDYGTDIRRILSGGSIDLDPYWTVISGPECVGQAVACRWVTTRGGLIDDETYGGGLLELINEPTDTATLFAKAAELEAQALDDERVSDCTVEITVEAEVATVSAVLILAEGETFRLVLAVSAVSVSVLEAG